MSEGAVMILTTDDLTPFADIDEAKAVAMITDAESMATLAAPCIADPEFRADESLLGAARAILRGAILRWHESGSGAVTQLSAGSFQQTLDTRSVRRGMFWPSEIDQLRDLCSRFTGSESRGSAFSIFPSRAPQVNHLPWCTLMMGGSYCSCGAILSGGSPIYEIGEP